jgi:hypothetical protein
MVRPAVTWGLVIGAVNALWLYATYWTGFHTGGIVRFQVVPLGWLLISSACYIAALRSWSAGARPPFGPTFRFGATIAVVTALLAIAMQVGYYTVIHPEWPQVMAEQTRAHFTARGADPAEVERRLEAAARNFTLRSYATQSAVAALLLGLILSAGIPAVLRWTRRGKAATTGA